jgi:hypothetical protein
MVFPVVVNPVRTSLPLQRHAGHCDDIPDVVGVHGGKTSPRLPLCRIRAPPLTALSNRPTDGGRTTNHYTATLEAAPVRAHDAP